jgi:predicted PhzF superfamily epimerase YddE/YHI9
MSDVQVDVVKVFTNKAGEHGNPLGVIGSSDATRGREQQIAARLGYSETVFVDDLDTAAGVARIRIFTPAAELPFAGHPSVGTAWWLAQRSTPVRVLAVPAGDVAVRYDGALTWVSAEAAWAPEFSWLPLGSSAEVDALDAAVFSARPGHHYAWAWIDQAAGRLRSRMFATDLGVPEDEATGAAAVRITDLLGRDLEIEQGVGSRISTRRLGGASIEVGGRVVPAASVALPL